MKYANSARDRLIKWLFKNKIKKLDFQLNFYIQVKQNLPLSWVQELTLGWKN